MSFEPLPRELVARAAAVGIDRLIWYPLVPVDRLETAVRQLGAQFGTAP